MYYSLDSSFASSAAGVGVWMIISAVVAIIGGFVVYFVFLTKENEKKLQGKAKWLYDFLAFKKLFAEVILKICYLIAAIYITLSSFGLISTSFVYFLLYLILGNVIARIAYEFALVILLICKNTTEINSKLKEK